eukprot:gene13384-19231_t
MASFKMAWLQDGAASRWCGFKMASFKMAWLQDGDASRWRGLKMINMDTTMESTGADFGPTNELLWQPSLEAQETHKKTGVWLSYAPGSYGEVSGVGLSSPTSSSYGEAGGVGLSSPTHSATAERSCGEAGGLGPSGLGSSSCVEAGRLECSSPIHIDAAEGLALPLTQHIWQRVHFFPWKPKGGRGQTKALV